jgi:hypothetical protein
MWGVTGMVTGLKAPVLLEMVRPWEYGEYELVPLSSLSE